MRIAAVLAIAFVVLVVGWSVTGPGESVDVPHGLQPAVADSRASILRHFDLIEPGTPLVVTEIRCREDGSVRLVFEARFLWLLPKVLVTEVTLPFDDPGKVAGGYVGRPDDGLEEWLAGGDEVACDRISE
jgi:hypothetical protein